jgi:hypothetical protein
MAQSKERVRKIVVLLDERMTKPWGILAKPFGWLSGREVRHPNGTYAMPNYSAACASSTVCGPRISPPG